MTIWTQILDSLPLLTAQAICTKGSARLLGLNDLFAMTRDQDKMLMRHSSFLTNYAMSLMSELSDSIQSVNTGLLCFFQSFPFLPAWCHSGPKPLLKKW